MRTAPAEAGKDERSWAEREFLGGQKQQVGKLGNLLGDYAEEREAERLRLERREQALKEADEFVPEEESESDDDDDAMDVSPSTNTEVDPFTERSYFERLIKEKYIYGLLDVRLRSWLIFVADNMRDRVQTMTVQTGMKLGMSNSTEMKRNGGLMMKRKAIERHNNGDICSSYTPTSMSTSTNPCELGWTALTTITFRFYTVAATSSTCMPLNHAFIGFTNGESFTALFSTSLFRGVFGLNSGSHSAIFASPSCCTAPTDGSAFPFAIDKSEQWKPPPIAIGCEEVD